MAGEDLDLDETGSEGGKNGKRKPLSQGQKIGIGIGIVTILLIIYQVRKQSAANAAASSSSSAAVDPLTGYPSGSPQDQQALASMYSASASTGSYPGSGGGGTVSGGVSSSGSDLATYLESLPSTNPFSPYYTSPTDTFTSNPSPSINVNVPLPDVITTPVATTAGQGGASTTNDSTPGANTLANIINSIDPNHTTVVVGGHTYYGIGNNPALTSISTAAHQQSIFYTQTNAKALGLPGGKATAQYIG
jgi:hypothetical protein